MRVISVGLGFFAVLTLAIIASGPVLPSDSDQEEIASLRAQLQKQMEGQDHSQ